MKTKNIFLALITVGVFWLFSAKSHYSWAENFKTEMGSNWIVFDEQRNAADPIYPYTLINPPISRVGLIEVASIKQIGDGVYKYNVVWADNNIGNRMPTEKFSDFSDCKRGLAGELKDGLKEFTQPADILWRLPSDNSLSLREDEKMKLVETFKRRCVILMQK